MTYKKTNKLSPVNAAYLAGLVDGEGSITLTKLSRNRQRGLAVTISNTELMILQHVLDIDPSEWAVHPGTTSQREEFIQRFFDIRPAETTGRPHPFPRSL